MTTTTGFAPGSLVSARGREWVVLPESIDDFLVLRPLGGTDDDIAGVIPAVEEVRSASFGLPSADDLGDYRSARLLRDALRIGFRSSGGPFRSLAGLSVSPRPYQLVPLLLALRQDTVRLLVADDVGIGKTVEAGLIAAELLAQGDAERLTVLCPPSLAEQWRQELLQKFSIDAVLVLPGTAKKLSNEAGYGKSIFEHFPFTIVSTDFIKSESKRHDFIRTAPDLIIVDEAHGVTADESGRGSSGRTQRYELVRELAKDKDRHLLLVTATPHSGNENAFRNLVSLLDERLKTLDLTRGEGSALLAEHMVQRRRADIRHFLRADTKFPSDRVKKEIPYHLSGEHKDLFDDVVTFARGKAQDSTGGKREQRIRWWSALSMLRSLASSPAAAAATLRTRAIAETASTAGEADLLGMAGVMDQMEDDGAEGLDVVPGALPDADSGEKKELSTLASLARRAEKLAADPASDAKLAALVKNVRELLQAGFQPIVFCRYIPTAHYVVDFLRTQLKSSVAIDVVTGELPSEERAARIEALAERAGSSQKVLVATDCLSEGVNLQDGFQAVVHYDLAWNPTRHEQREGRVDRFGQLSETVRAVTIYGEDNGIDGLVLQVLLRKHESIRKDLGVSVPVPPRSDQVMAALIEGLLMRGHDPEQGQLDLGLDVAAKELDAEWRSTAEAEKASRARYAQNAIRPEQVQTAVDAAQRSLGEPREIPFFVRSALEDTGAHLTSKQEGFEASLSVAAAGVKNALGGRDAVEFVPDYPAPRGAGVLVRTDPKVTALAAYVLNSALDDKLTGADRPARRAGIITTSAVAKTTVALLVRFRTKLILPARLGDRTDIAEEARLLAFTGAPSDPTWLDDAEIETLMDARPTANPSETAKALVPKVLAALEAMEPLLNEKAQAIADEIREAHVEVRLAARGTSRAGRLGVRGLEVQPNLPADILGVYLYTPDQGAK
ncbi:superfamily II DNA or RNA helicase [Sinomonas atrocyanea]|uniref:helicase-related protein n=1 Tax=Sinomonas atrocyanea TaxID=37927 RepID=UPI002787E31C|nr:helicase-related protein [Sinomonas atrocyanea]MDQ0260457.1 superfamily II DNA or RNA helicase [Sinomonas atrocyanea]